MLEETERARMLGYLDKKTPGTQVTVMVSLKVVSMLSEVPFPSIDPSLFLRLQSFSPFSLIYSPDYPLCLVPASFEVSSCEGDNFIDLFWRVDEVPSREKRRRAWINAFHVRVS